MRVLIMSDANSIHTIKWVQGLSAIGMQIGLWSLSVPQDGLYEELKNVTTASAGIQQKRTGVWNKVKYLGAAYSVNRFIKAFKPDIVHAHYASSYGLLASLAGFHPLVISVWGSDIFDFPKSNYLFKKVITFNLKSADKILSTSHVMAEETRKYTRKNITVTPFGIDLRVFYKVHHKSSPNDRPFIFGTIKTLETKYGINDLIEAFSILKKRLPDRNIKLCIVGGGSQEQELKQLARERGVDQYCDFTGPVSFKKVPYYHNLMDVSVFLSVLDSESFGVSAVEASATETAVIVSDVGGLPEVVENNVTGIVVPPRDPMAAAAAMEKLYLNKELRDSMGRNGRRRVEALYNWDHSVLQMTEIYNNIFSGKVHPDPRP